MSLKIGDRCTVEVRTFNSPSPPRYYRGQIMGESKDGLWWLVRRDAFKRDALFRKDFVHETEVSHCLTVP